VRAANDFNPGPFPGPTAAAVPPLGRVSYQRLAAPPRKTNAIVKLEARITELHANIEPGELHRTLFIETEGDKDRKKVVKYFWDAVADDHHARYAFIHFPAILSIISRSKGALNDFTKKLTESLGRTRRGLFLNYVDDLLTCSNTVRRCIIGERAPSMDAVMTIL
ncbi:hypothetical protein HKX48_005457, partial [Thoreauomyces humboldtii]